MKKIHFWGLSYNDFGGGIGKFVEEVICSLRKNNDVKSVKLFAKHDKYKSYKGYTIHKTFGGINLIKNICYAFMVSLYSLLERPTLIFCSHINYSPCALFLKFFITLAKPKKIDSPIMKCPILNSSIPLTFVNTFVVL